MAGKLSLWEVPILKSNTPVEVVGRIWVKREDLCAPASGPQFSKMRGVFAHIKDRPESIIGVLDTFHSMAGWAVAYVCRELNKRCINFWPQYKAQVEGELREFQSRSHDMGAELVALPAGRSAILFYRARAWLKENHPSQSYLMPNALKLEETVEETAKEVLSSPFPPDVLRRDACWVISISSGTVAAGVLLGLQRRGLSPKVVLHLGYSRSEEAVRHYMRKHGVTMDFDCVDEGYSYKDRSHSPLPPFPCNVYYDLKAWAWIQKSCTHSGPILFWNIGA